MNIALIGTGGVAENLAVALSNQHIVTLCGKSIEAIMPLTGYKTLWNASINYIPEQTEILIIAVQDSNILDVVENIPFHNLPHLKVVAHTSGSIGIDVFLSYTQKGAVFYPLQTFSKGRTISLENVPIFIEACTKENEVLLFELARQIQANPMYADTKKRAHIHLGAVFAQNFSNFLLEVAHQITEKQALSHNIYYPLLQETLNKAEKVSPLSVQTGPAKRKDYNTIQSHIRLLQKEFPEYEALYRILTDYIVEFTCKPKR